MYICTCNPFTDKDVKKVLESPAVSNTPAQVYKAASDGCTPCCGTCLCAIKDMIVDHKSTLGVEKLKTDLPEITEPTELINAD